VGALTLRAAVRFVASVLIVSGLLLLVDAGLTLTWQEPVSAYMANRDQDRLAKELADAPALLRRDKLAVGPQGTSKAQIAALARRQAARAKTGHAIGKIEFPTLHRHYYVVQGTTTGALRNGPGHYPDTAFPGRGRTVAIAGHRTTYGAPFRSVDKLHPGDQITLAMPYARFTYRVERTRIVKPTALWVKRNVGHDELVLSACHPLYSAAKRIVVFARLSFVEPL
jgi:sortase A